MTSSCSDRVRIMFESAVHCLDDRPGYNYLDDLLSCLSTGYKFSK